VENECTIPNVIVLAICAKNYHQSWRKFDELLTKTILLSFLGPWNAKMFCCLVYSPKFTPQKHTCI